MKYRILSLMLVAIALCSVGMRAQTREYTLNVGDFGELTVVDAINVVYKQSTDSMGMAVFRCPDAIAHRMEFNNNKHKLKIMLAEGADRSNLPTITVYSTALTYAANWADSTLTLERLAPCAQLKVKVIGNGRLNVSGLRCTQFNGSIQTGSGRLFVQGHAQTASLSCTGSGVVEASQLHVPTVKCSLYGTGSIECCPTEQLNISGAGSGKVYYTGNPKIKNHSLGVKAIAVDTAR